MKKFFVSILLFITMSVLSQESIGKDSGNKNIMIYKSKKSSDTALVVMGGIHGDEYETVDSVYYIKNNLKTDISTYFIPTINPTLTSPSVRKRGYKKDQLNSEGFLLKDGNPNSFNKELYYRIFYGNENTYKQGIENFIDPNRDFINQILPSTKVLIELLNKLSKEYSDVILISLHGYMSGGRIYPEYRITDNNNYITSNKAWEYCKIIAQGSGFTSEEMYSPAVSIIERFSGELVTYTSRYENLISIDIELNSINREKNSEKVLNGLKNLLEYIKLKQ